MPNKYLDIVLTNLAGLLYKTGSLGDAISVLEDAVALNDKEPGTNFFLANLYTIKGQLPSILDVKCFEQTKISWSRDSQLVFVVLIDWMIDWLNHL